MDKLKGLIIINLFLIKLCFGQPDQLLYSKDENDGTKITKSNGEELYYPNNLTENDNFISEEGNSFLERSITTASRRNTNQNKIGNKPTKRENITSNEVKRINRKPVTRNIKRKNTQTLKNHDKFGDLYQSKGRRDFKNKKDGINLSGARKRNYNITKERPIRRHNFDNDYSENEEESKTQIRKKIMENPKIKGFAVSVGKKLGQQGLEMAKNLAKDLINDKIMGSEDDENKYESKSDDDLDIEDLLSDKEDDKKHKENNEFDDEKEDFANDENDKNNENEGDYDEEGEEENDEQEYSDNDSEEEDNSTKLEDLDNEENEDNKENEQEEEDNYDQKDEEEEEEEEEEEDYAKKFKTPSGLEYLGAGYDIIKGNPLGDNVTLLDPGYKSTVIQMHWNKKPENISNSLKFLQPVGGWIRPYSSCHKVETVSEIISSDSILKSLSADSSVSFSLPGDSVKFSASDKFKKLDDASKSGKTGISTSLDWDFTLGFQSSLLKLSEEFKGLEDNSSCKPYVYREDPNNENCQDLGVNDWMDLFNIFGTHVATKIYLGGKIFNTMEVKKNQEKKLSDQGIDVKAVLSAQIKDTEIDSKVNVSVVKSSISGENLLDTKKSTFVLGGDIYGHGKTINFSDWAKSVSEHPMPIKAEFTPISHFLDQKLREAYNIAYIYYGKVVLESDFMRYQSQEQLTPEDMINELEIKNSEGTGSVKCSDGKFIQFGFMVITLKDKTHEIQECPIHSTECSIPKNKEIFHSTIWIACRSQNLLNLKQIITKEKEAHCDSGFNILLGSYFFSSNSKYLLIKPCKIGENKCESSEDSGYIWIVCTKKFWDPNSKSKVVKKLNSSEINCSEGESIAFGFVFEWIKNSDITFANFISCKKDLNGCFHECKNSCNRIAQYIVCK